MPTYDYRCTDCEHTFERFEAIIAKPLKMCPLCEGKVKRLIGKGGAVIFRGSGFHCNDYPKQRREPDKKEREE